MENLENLSINQIANVIALSWKNVNYAALPYLQAMHCINKDTDKYGCEEAKDIVIYFLSNSSAYRGETAKAVKKELKRRFNIK